FTLWYACLCPICGNVTYSSTVLSSQTTKRTGPAVFCGIRPTFRAHAAAAMIALRQALPPSMVPSIILPLIDIPRTASGKVRLEALHPDKLALYQPSVSSSANQDDFSEPEKVFCSASPWVLRMSE
ncbi:nonribosomal peptide synthase, putative, partial [Aspergillus lentulus]